MTNLSPSVGSPHAAILGIGSYRPSRVIPNAEIVEAIDSSDEWIQQRSGIKQRRWATPEETVTLMSVASSRIAAGVAWAFVGDSEVRDAGTPRIARSARTPSASASSAGQSPARGQSGSCERAGPVIPRG